MFVAANVMTYDIRHAKVHAPFNSTFAIQYFHGLSRYKILIEKKKIKSNSNKKTHARSICVDTRASLHLLFSKKKSIHLISYPQKYIEFGCMNSI